MTNPNMPSRLQTDKLPEYRIGRRDRPIDSHESVMQIAN